MFLFFFSFKIDKIHPTGNMYTVYDGRTTIHTGWIFGQSSIAFGHLIKPHMKFGKLNGI